MGQIHVVVGGQFGSEAKGHVTGWLAREMEDVAAVVRVAGPNAGHTAYDDQGRPFALRQIPVAAVTNRTVDLLIGAGSEIDPAVLADEIERLETAGIPVVDRLYVDEQATVITEAHKLQETGVRLGSGDSTLVQRIGSTGKGVGAARSARIMRHAMTWGTYVEEGETAGTALADVQTTDPIGTIADRIHHELQRGHRIIIEGTQGFGLGLHAGFYPYCTSSDCRAIDFLSMAGVTPHNGELVVWPVFRTFPIRVAGNSGPLYGETTWENLAEQTDGYIKPERTTVTNKIRRVGQWDYGLAQAAIEANGGEQICRPVLTFLDYWRPEVAGVKSTDGLDEQAWNDIQGVEDGLGCKLWAVGTGPDSIVQLADKPL